jgi:DNA repair photolyase
VELIEARSLFIKAAGFIRRGGFDWTCNPYVGCTFGCSYCYAMFLPQNDQPKEQWGKWLRAKQNAVELARKAAHRVAGQALYLSSVTDPYQPVERSLLLTRGILEALVPHQPRLVVQTRGPLVVRDIDVLRQLRSLRVNLSIPTDDDDIRRRFEPKAPTLEKRWQAARELRAAGIPLGICVTPMLPLRNIDAFAERLIAFRPDVLVVQEFHQASGFGADTSQVARDLASQFAWGREGYRRCLERLRRERTVYEGEEGFFPPPAAQASVVAAS